MKSDNEISTNQIAWQAYWICWKLQQLSFYVFETPIEQRNKLDVYILTNQRPW